MVINVQYSVHTYSINTITLTSLYSNCPTRSVYHNGWFSVRQMIVTKRKTFSFFFLLKPKTDTSIFTSLKNVHEYTRIIVFWLTNSVKGVRMKEMAQSPRSSPTLEPIQSLKCTLSTYRHKSLPTVTPIIQQLIEGWLSVLCPARLEMRHEALRRKRDTDRV